MKTIITALLNKTVNDKLKEYNEIQVIMNDIQYQDGIIEALETNNNIDYIILSELLPGEKNINELIKKIKEMRKDINIILILKQENKELENDLITKDVTIFYNNQIEIKEIANLIIQNNKKQQMEEEIKELKKIILEKENREKLNLKIQKLSTITKEEQKEIEKEIEIEYFENNLKNKLIKRISTILKKDKENKNTKIIFISGIPGVGKSIFTINLAKALCKKKKKTLIIDCDYINNSIKILFGIKNKNENSFEQITNENIEKFFQNNFEKETKEEKKIIKINSYIKLLSISEQKNIFYNNEIEEEKLQNIINELKVKFDVILIDTENINKNLDLVMQNSEKIIFITEPNILQIKKSKILLEKYINENKFEKEKLYILFNKVKNGSITFNILKDAFKNYNILGKIDYIKNCDLLVNHNMKNIFLIKQIKKQYEKVAKNVIKNNDLKKYYINKINDN